jgi:hypothetical protein
MKKDSRRKGALLRLVSLLATLQSACTPEATAPQGGAAISRVVPLAIPDVWCPAQADGGQDSTSAKDAPRPPAACDAPRHSASGKGTPAVAVDSAWASPDTTK